VTGSSGADAPGQQPAVGPAAGGPTGGGLSAGALAGSGRTVDIDLSELATLGARPLSEHAEVFGRIHESLQLALARLDTD
jgi:hypothetical protein